jgi:hypothetical protein
MAYSKTGKRTEDKETTEAQAVGVTTIAPAKETKEAQAAGVSTTASFASASGPKAKKAGLTAGAFR